MRRQNSKNWHQRDECGVNIILCGTWDIESKERYDYSGDGILYCCSGKMYLISKYLVMKYKLGFILSCVLEKCRARPVFSKGKVDLINLPDGLSRLLNLAEEIQIEKRLAKTVEVIEIFFHLSS